MKLNYFHFKMIAIIAMSIDHIAWLFIETSSFLGQSMHFIGRITAPLMCFLLVEGFNKSSNISLYLRRILVFALLSQIPFTMMLNGVDKIILDPFILFKKFNILFNLFLALLSLIVLKSKFSIITKFFILGFYLFISNYIDWGVFIIFFTLVLFIYRNDHDKQIIAYLITAMSLLIITDLGFISALPPLVLQWMPLGILILPLFLKLSNHEFGSRWGGRYFFYWFYPLHMLILTFSAYLKKVGG